jgi:hypothetical protein
MVADLEGSGPECFKILSQDFQTRMEQTTRTLRQKFLQDLALRDKMPCFTVCQEWRGIEQ